MLDALYRAWKDDIEAGRTSLMIAGDLATVSELNARARADRVAAGHVDPRRAGRGRRRHAPGSATRSSPARTTGVSAPDGGGSATATRGPSRRTHPGRIHDRPAGRGWRQGGPAGRLRDASTSSWPTPRRRIAPRAAPSTPRTPWCSPTTTREVLYVMATRGREANRLYVDTHYDPDPQTSHGEHGRATTARDVLFGVLRNEGADVAAHDMIRRQQARGRGHGTAVSRVPDAGHAGPGRALGRPAGRLRTHRGRTASRFGPVRRTVR